MMKKANCKFIGVFTFVVSLLMSQHAAATVMPQFACDYHIKRMEKEQGIPSQLLLAIAKVESGHFDKQSNRTIAWPWSINVQGKGYKFRSKQEAIKAIKSHLANGVKSIDVGCMQVNLAYHGEMFNSIEEAIEPKNNVEYAAQFLRGLRNEHASWTTAVAHYHSATPEHHIPYRQKVFEMWFKERRQGDYMDTSYDSSVYGVPALGTFRTLRFNGLKNRVTMKPRIIRLKQASAQKNKGFQVNYRRGQIDRMTDVSSTSLKESVTQARPVIRSRYFKTKPFIKPTRKISSVGRPHTIRFKS